MGGKKGRMESVGRRVKGKVKEVVVREEREQQVCRRTKMIEK